MAHPVYRTADGKRVPSVTTVLTAVLAKPQLVAWANRMGLAGVEIESYRDELADVGTWVHESIRCYLFNVDPDLPDLDDQHLEMALAAFSRWLDWLERHPMKPLFGERSMVSENYRFGGTVDCVTEMGGELVLCDWKTSRAVYDDHLHQVSAYRALLAENGVHVERAVVVHVGRTDGEGFGERWMDPDEMDERFEVFDWCLRIYRRQQELTRGRS